MAFLVFALSLVLLVAGLAGAYQSLDLLPTGIGVLYAIGGAVAICAAILTFALGVMIRRIETLAELVRRLQPGAVVAAEAVPIDRTFAPTPVEARTDEETQAEAQEGQWEGAEERAPPETEEPVNEYRSGHLPTLGEIEHAIESPEPPPSLIGRYASGGANYMIFADGSIEAETPEGTFKFASMGDFRRYLADRKDDGR